MRLAVFGGTDRTGRWLVGRALAIGHDVVALASSPGQMGLLHEHLHIVAGDPLDPAAVAETVAGADAVISLLQPAARPAPLAVSRATAQIIEAMQKLGVHRLLVVTDRDVRDAEDQPTWAQRFSAWLKSLIASDLQADNWTTAAQVRASDLDWTLVRVPRLVDEMARRPAQAGYLGPKSGRTLERSALAAFLLQQIDRPEYVRQAPLLTH